MGGTQPGVAAPRPPWPEGAAWIDGRYCPIQEAKISVLDLGVTRSDCTYDVVHVWRGRFYRLDGHLDRFPASMARLRLDSGCSRAEIERSAPIVRRADCISNRPCGSRAASDAQENDQCPVKPKDAGVIKHPDLHAEPGAAHGSDLIHHDPAGSVQAVALIRLDKQPLVALDFARIWQVAGKIGYSATLQAPDTSRTRIDRDFDLVQVRKLTEAAAR